MTTGSTVRSIMIISIYIIVASPRHEIALMKALMSDVGHEML